MAQRRRGLATEDPEVGRNQNPGHPAGKGLRHLGGILIQGKELKGRSTGCMSWFPIKGLFPEN